MNNRNNIPNNGFKRMPDYINNNNDYYPRYDYDNNMYDNDMIDLYYRNNGYGRDNRYRNRQYNNYNNNYFPGCDRYGRCGNPLWWIFWPFFF